MENNVSLTKKITLPCDVLLQICYKKNFSLWLIDGNTRYFVTCNKRSIKSLCRLDDSDLEDLKNRE